MPRIMFSKHVCLYATPNVDKSVLSHKYSVLNHKYSVLDHLFYVFPPFPLCPNLLHDLPSGMAGFHNLWSPEEVNVSMSVLFIFQAKICVPKKAHLFTISLIFLPVSIRLQPSWQSPPKSCCWISSNIILSPWQLGRGQRNMLPYI